ncbi:MAG: hypothetical protein LBD84_02895 [Campylobacteraceae bacterium]|nr:hypothetical protein [Campylobacteraceae bacterium]
MPTVIITSAAYVNTEIAAEYGHIPPAFLPFGHSRLFEHQVRRLRKQNSNIDIVLTVPDNYDMEKCDADWLNSNNISVIKISDNISLGNSIGYALSKLNLDGNVCIYHGDSLFDAPLPFDNDVVCVSLSKDSYRWGRLSGQENIYHNANNIKNSVLCGWFAISDAVDFLRSVTIASGDFIQALNLYEKKHQIKFYYIDSWLDFGHLHTLYRSKTKIDIARQFNSVNIDSYFVSKNSDNKNKIMAEANWFETIPWQLKIYTPTFFCKDNDGYRVAYELSPTLHELYIFSNFNISTWQWIFDECFNFLSKCKEFAKYNTDDKTINVMQELTYKKTISRISLFAKDNDIDLKQEWKLNGKKVPSLMKVIENTSDIIKNDKNMTAIMHGDFCFTNIFFDFRQGLIKVIDPRGSIVDNKYTIFGDSRYDLAKLNHSVEGYDLILAQRFYYFEKSSYDVDFLLFHTNITKEIIKEISNFSVDGCKTTNKSIIASTIQLFLSMLPLHSDRKERQKAFIANALRLYLQLDSQ